MISSMTLAMWLFDTDAGQALQVNVAGIVVCAIITWRGYLAAKRSADQALSVASGANDLSDKANRIAEDALSYVKKKDEVDVTAITGHVSSVWDTNAGSPSIRLNGYYLYGRVYCGGKDVFIEWVRLAKDADIIQEFVLEGPPKLQHGELGEYGSFAYANTLGSEKLREANRLIVRTAGGHVHSTSIEPWITKRAAEEQEDAEAVWAKNKEESKNKIHFG